MTTILSNELKSLFKYSILSSESILQLPEPSGSQLGLIVPELSFRELSLSQSHLYVCNV